MPRGASTRRPRASWGTSSSARPSVRPGRPYPLGATPDAEGVNFALYSENASEVEVCLYDADDPRRETQRLRLREVTAHVWHGHVPGLAVGQLYGFRVKGPWKPKQGLRFNANKLLMDPYARAVSGELVHDPAIFGY